MNIPITTTASGTTQFVLRVGPAEPEAGLNAGSGGRRSGGEGGVCLGTLGVPTSLAVLDRKAVVVPAPPSALVPALVMPSGLPPL